MIAGGTLENISVPYNANKMAKNKRNSRGPILIPINTLNSLTSLRFAGNY